MIPEDMQIAVFKAITRHREQRKHTIYSVLLEVALHRLSSLYSQDSLLFQ
jgi:hypothetical protein